MSALKGRHAAAVGSAAWFLVAPGVVAGAIPWWLTGWEVRDPSAGLQVLGAALLVAGAAVLVHAFAGFVVEGAGTPAPVAPPQRLVVGGLYRHVRNPMYLALLGTIAGQALVLGQASLALYGGIVCAAVLAFAHGYEEPVLRRRFGESYEAYRRAVPAWLPRLRPWNPP